MSKPTLLLLATDHCSLCDDALDLLAGTPELAGASLQVVDIADDDGLVERYGRLLPVLAVRAESGELRATLAWPFDGAAISRWLAELE